MRLSSLSTALFAAFTWATTAAAADDAEPEIKSVSLRTHTLVQPYLDSDMSSRWFDFGGDTVVRTDSYIRLTSDRPSQAGWLFSRVPLTATNWEVEVEFKISGRNQLYGDGMAMWVTRQRGQQGDVFGHVDNFEGLGIFLDTYKNNRPGVVFPYVMAMFGDGNTPYDKNNDGKAAEMAGCSARGLRNAKQPTKLRLTYFQDKQLKLELQYKKENEWQLCFDSDSPPAIPNIAYLGFSAETGELSDNHDIVSVKARNLYSAPSSSRDKSTPGNKNRTKSRSKQQGSGTWMWFLTKVLLFFMVVAVAYVGFTMYRTKSKSHRF